MQEKLRRHQRRKQLLVSICILIVVTSTISAFLFFTTYLGTYSVKGNVYVSSDHICQHLFVSDMDQRYYYVKARETLEEPKYIPMIESYTMTFVGTGHVNISVVEKNPIGGILFAEGAYLYFDDEGYVLCTKNEMLPGVPVIEGVHVTQPKKYEKLQVDQGGVFEEIMLITGLIQKYGMEVEAMRYDEEQNIALKMGNIRIELGTSRNMEGKISELRDMQSSLEGLRGVLHLENYDSLNQNGNYIFERE